MGNVFFCSVQLKELLSERNEGVAISQLCLIFAGKILKDDETLEKQGVKDGLTIHMVIRSSGAKVRLTRGMIHRHYLGNVGTLSQTLL